MPIVCISCLCIISGAASIAFIESMLSLYLDKQVIVSLIATKVELVATILIVVRSKNA